MNYQQYEDIQKVANELFLMASNQTFPHEAQFSELGKAISDIAKAIKKIPQNLQMEAMCYAVMVYNQEMQKNV